MKKKVISFILSLVFLISISIPAFAQNEQYTYVLVHGLGGWGDNADINNLSPYWGSTTGNLADYLKTQNYNVYEATVGPFSSSWDRACELYAQLTGTTVDYGAAHSKEHQHERFGKTYSEPAIEWSRKNKVNLIGHSFGGATIRLLAHLMEYGAPEEIAITEAQTSELFTGGKGNYIHSVTTLCSPHNGSTVYDILDKFPHLIDILLGSVSILDTYANIPRLESVYDIGLKQFNPENFVLGIDNAGYELSPKGANELNKKIKTVDSIYYFSFASSTTVKHKKNQIPTKNTLSLLILPATLMGSYNHPVLCKENDGLVNVNSALYPFTDNYINYDGINFIPGIWTVMPMLRGHHGTIIGMDNNTQEVHEFYSNHFKLIDELQQIHRREII